MKYTMPKPATVDFETNGIQSRPSYPPVPVGVSIKPWGKKPRYYGWGHPSGNNCTRKEAVKALQEVWSGLMLFQNAKFDVDVATHHLKLPMPKWGAIHDTLYLLFLDEPHAKTFSLKPSAERLLNMPPEERDSVREWLTENKVVRANDGKWGAFIAQAPGDVVGPYANGDTDRTERLFKLLYPRVVERGMLPAYDRERELMPILLENERQGLRVNVKRLKRDCAMYTEALQKTDAWIRKRLKAPTLNVESNDDLADALDKAGIVKDWVLTPTGKRSTSKDNMKAVDFKDKCVSSALGYRNRLATCLGTFLLPWLETAQKTGGTIHTDWNQVRQSRSENKKNTGTRTGRLSSSPNFQNIPTDFSKDDTYVFPEFLAVPALPFCREYILPDDGEVFGHIDYNQQELRILAHYEDGVLRSTYESDPRADLHDFVKSKIKSTTGKDYDRKYVKITNFGIIYGEGAASLAVRMGIPVQNAKDLKAAHRKALPGVRDLEANIKSMGKRGESIRTWGGREYFCEPPMMVKGREMTFEYKLLNYLIQGSAADCTKQAMINYHKMKKHGRLLVQVHDELNISAPPKYMKSEMEILRKAMEMVEFDVPMLTDGSTGPNWANLKKAA